MRTLENFNPNDSFARFRSNNTYDFPFLCADVTHRSMRVPGGTARQHPHGTKGIIGITVAVTGLNAPVLRYNALLGIETRQDADSPLPEKD